MPKAEPSSRPLAAFTLSLPLSLPLSVSLSVSLSLSVPHAARADGAASSGAEADAPPAAEIENLVVTASRVAVPAERVGSAVTVLSREALDARGPVLVADALRDVPGIAVSRGGGHGGVTQARIRGAEGNHTLVLIDGIEANNPVADSEFDFANLPVGDIERIEVLRGPQSALHGSDAIGGVINVITRGRRPGFDARMRAEAGNLGTSRASLSIGGGGERATGGIHVSRYATDGENYSRFGGERDGFENESLALDGRARLGERFTLKANLHYLDSRQEFDSQDFAVPATPTQGLLVDDDVTSRLRQWLARVEGTAELEHAAHRFGVSVTDTGNRFFDAGLPTGRNDGEKTKIDYQTTLSLGGDPTERERRALTLALERERIDYANLGASPDAPENQAQSDTQTSVVAEYRHALERAAISLSARRDENRLFEDASTWRVAASYDLTEDTRLRASAGTGVTNPGFFDLFGFFPGSFAGNPSLVPEHATSFDVGIDHAFGPSSRIRATYFRADLEDEIVSVFDPERLVTSVDNLAGDSERRGGELELSARPAGRWRIAASYTYTDAREPGGAPELRRPRHTASIDNTVELLSGRVRLNVGVDHVGRQLDSELVFATPEDRVALPSFTLVDVSASLALTPRVELHARIANLLDEEYEEWFSYRGRGRAWTAGFSVRLGG